MTKRVRIVHYLNQFFAGQGGEDKANIELSRVDGPVGPGKRLQSLLGDRGEISATLVAGDNWAAELAEVAIPRIRKAIEEIRPDAVLAGPAFNAGRYGLVCGEVCRIAESLGIPAVTSMFEENPGVLTHGKRVVIVPCSEEVQGMEPALKKMAALALKMASGATLGPADEEGYLPRGVRREGARYASAARRAGDMLMARIGGTRWTTELRVEAPDAAIPARPIQDLSRAAIALITSGGLVPKGNPEGQVRGGATSWWKYPIGDVRSLSPGDWESVHRGFYLGITNENPNYILPLDVMRQFEDAGVIGSVHPQALSISGVGTHVSDARRIGKEMAEYLRQQDIDGALLVAT